VVVGVQEAQLRLDAGDSDPVESAGGLGVAGARGLPLAGGPQGVGLGHHGLDQLPLQAEGVPDRPQPEGQHEGEGGRHQRVLADGVRRAPEQARGPGQDRFAGQEAAQIVAQGAGAAVAAARRLGHGLGDDGLQRLGDVRAQAAGRDRVLGHHLGHHHQQLGVLEGGAAGDQLVQGRAQRVDVAALVAALAAGLFGRHVRGRAQHRAGQGQRRAAAGHPGHPEVGDPDMGVPLEEQVLGLDVPVDDAAAVGVVDGVDRLDQQLDRAPGRGHQLAHRAPADQLHGQVVAALLLAHLVDGDDVGMREARGHLRLAGEALAVDGLALVDDLEGHEALQAQLPGAVDHAGAAAAHPLEQDVASQSCLPGRLAFRQPSWFPRSHDPRSIVRRAMVFDCGAPPGMTGCAGPGVARGYGQCRSVSGVHGRARPGGAHSGFAAMARDGGDRQRKAGKKGKDRGTGSGAQGSSPSSPLSLPYPFRAAQPKRGFIRGPLGEG
jgi:hypothetical protein